MAEISTLNGYKIKDKKAIRYYNTVADMVTDTTLKNGMYAVTKGYYAINDNGGSEYHITNIASQTDYQETLNKLRKVKFTNITTSCSNKTLQNAISTHNINEGMLYLSDKVIFDGEKSDGMVSLKSAKYIEEVSRQNGINISTITILDGHHDIGSDIRIIQEILNECMLKKDTKVNEEFIK